MNEHLTSAEIARYDRHLALPQVGESGQLKLRNTSVLLVGLGGLGSPLGLYLAAAGIGRLGLVDFDRVDESNLQRQIAYSTNDVGELKTKAAFRRLRALNPHVQVDLIPQRLTDDNALQIIADYDIVADGSDNFVTRYLVNDACVLSGKPNVYGSIYQFEGQASIFGSPDGPCYRCLYDRPPPVHLVPSCSEGGVLGVLPGLIGTIQATEVLKLSLGIGETLAGKLLLVDALTMQFRTLAIDKNPDCPICGQRPSITGLVDYEAFCASGTESAADEITVRELKARIDRGDTPFILDVRQQEEYERSNLGGVLIPLQELSSRLTELDSYRHDDQIVVHCKSGVRSAKAVAMLRAAGFTNAVNLRGGVLSWEREIGSIADPTS